MISSEKVKSIKLLVNTGKRPGESWALRWGDVDFKNEQILVRSYNGFTPKGKKDRNIPVNANCLELLKEHESNRNGSNVFVYRQCRSDRVL